MKNKKLFLFATILIVIFLVVLGLNFDNRFAYMIVAFIDMASGPSSNAPHQYQGEISDLNPYWYMQLKGLKKAIYLEEPGAHICPELPESRCPTPITIIKKCVVEQNTKKCVVGSFSDLSLGQKVIVYGNPGSYNTFHATEIEILQ